MQNKVYSLYQNCNFSYLDSSESTDNSPLTRAFLECLEAALMIQSGKICGGELNARPYYTDVKDDNLFQLFEARTVPDGSDSPRLQSTTHHCNASIHSDLIGQKLTRVQNKIRGVDVATRDGGDPEFQDSCQVQDRAQQTNSTGRRFTCFGEPFRFRELNPEPGETHQQRARNLGEQRNSLTDSRMCCEAGTGTESGNLPSERAGINLEPGSGSKTRANEVVGMSGRSANYKVPANPGGDSARPGTKLESGFGQEESLPCGRETTQGPVVFLSTKISRRNHQNADPAEPEELLDSETDKMVGAPPTRIDNQTPNRVPVGSPRSPPHPNGFHLRGETRTHKTGNLGLFVRDGEKPGSGLGGTDDAMDLVHDLRYVHYKSPKRSRSPH